MQLNRRTMIAASGAALAAAALPGCSRRSGTFDAIVLGAGISGLQTALLLEQQGLKVLTIEARNEVGGRIRTLFDQPGTPELGFNSMGAGYGRGIDAAKNAGVELWDVAPRFMADPRQQLVLGGQLMSREQWLVSPLNTLPSEYRAMMPWEVVFAAFGKHNRLKDWSRWAEAGNKALDISVRDFLKAQGLDDASVRLVYDSAPYYGVTAEDSAALSYEFQGGWVASQQQAGRQSFAVKGGNQKLPQAMAARLKGDVLLGREVTAIDSDGKRVTVTCRDGSQHMARRVVSSLPFSTLRKVAITPKLSGLQAEAVANLPYQPISIAFLTASHPWWEEDGLPPSMWTDGPLGIALAQHFGPDPKQVSGFLVFARGNLAKSWDKLGKESALATVVAEFERLRPASRGKVMAAAFHSWANEPFNLGDWAYFHPGQITRFAKTMGQPAGLLHFCGEHTALANRGLEGALESSERVALEIIAT